MKIILDTCSLIWLCSEPGKLSKRAADEIDDETNTCLVSYASIWEMALKTRSGKIIFPQPLRRWIGEQKDRWEFEWLPISLDHILITNELQDHHNDPFDRLLVAQAQSGNIPIVSPDEYLRKYPVHVIW